MYSKYILRLLDPLHVKIRPRGNGELMQLKSSLAWLTWDEVTRASPAAQSFYSKLFKWLCWTAVGLLSGNIIQFPAA